MKLVKTKTPANANKTIPNVPGITFVKYKTLTTKARIRRMIRSVIPIFFFIFKDFGQRRSWKLCLLSATYITQQLIV